MQSTTILDTHRQKAEELIAVRDKIKRLTAKENSRVTNDILIQSAILITRHDRFRTGYDSKRLDNWFEENGIDSTRFVKTTQYSTISAKAV